MLNKSVARRYAEAFFSIAQDNNKIDQFQTELEKVVAKINELENLKEYFAHLLIPAKEKKEVAKKLFQEDLSPTTLSFILMVIDKRRETYFEAILDEYKEMADESRNITKADLIVAREVPEDEVEVLAQKLSATSGKTVQLKVAVDPSLIGGIKIRMGDQIIDGTVAKRLEMLRESLKKAKIS
ncbi:ATP synthase delta chain [Candidatus Syntrophocurvum alkaliphilum]|uniref:ATP synthase subunit delta n=1 Tax=Candidatus Syntrophocurvum alkaliphilum TaxID=2293317 RepID=A0A6I6DPE6_9FIRM|nr:F0F1 ATP synthase subunit delta [Candidatus Syntrophocurvum alkaliphilum]QGU00728.1 ATP synthase delta chain [Candidatus Syntrophocurvum alkaliphilum]